MLDPPAASVQPVLEAIGISRRDPTADNWLIRDVSLAMHRGDRMGILGPSGAGKTVLLRALAMLDPLDAGVIYWKGDPVLGDSVPEFRKHAIYLHQRPALLDGTVEANLRYPFTLNSHRSRRFDRERATELLASLGRERSFLTKSSRDLSGGEAQLVAFVRAVQLEPAVLMLDEPTASLDPPTARALEVVIDDWMAAKAGSHALIWVSHDREQTCRMTARWIVLCAGRVESEE